MKIEKSSGLRGNIEVPGDKSISHRAVLIGSIAEGDTRISHFLPGADCLATIDCMRRLGVSIEVKKSQGDGGNGFSSTVIVHGAGKVNHRDGGDGPDDSEKDGGDGPSGLKPPTDILDAKNSGTTMRLLSGILAGQDFASGITGDDSLKRRPMKRIIEPLEKMGAKIVSADGNRAPLTIRGGHLKGIAYQSPVASAQVKSCILFAGLYADGMTCVVEPAMSRNHTELMLSRFGADIAYDLFDPAKLDMKGMDGVPIVPGVVLRPGQPLKGQDIVVPGDISSAAYFLAAGLLVPDSEITLKNVGINPTRDGILRVIAGMGGYVEISNQHEEGNELVADLVVSSSPLRGVEIGGGIIPTLIDEIPMIAVMAAFAEGDTIISDAGELRVKETDRLTAIAEDLRLIGTEVETTDDGMIIHGKGNTFIGGQADADGSTAHMDSLHGAVIDPKGDHRMAMAFTVAGLVTGGMEIKGAECVDVSYPGFFEDIKKLK